LEGPVGEKYCDIICRRVTSAVYKAVVELHTETLNTKCMHITSHHLLAPGLYVHYMWQYMVNTVWSNININKRCFGKKILILSLHDTIYIQILFL